MKNVNTVFSVDPNQREIAEHKTDDIPCVSYTDKYFNNSYHWHWHDEFELSVVANGSVEVSVGSERYILNENDGIFINSGVIHKYGSAETNKPCIMPNVVFHPSFICGIDDTSIKKKYITPILNSTELSYCIFRNENKADAAFLKYIRRAYDELENKSWGYEFRLREALEQFILQLVPIAGSYSDTPVTADTYRIRTMMNYIKNNFRSRITLADIAVSAGVSIRECQRCFLKNLNIAPMQYIIDMRIDYAKKLLLETTEEISSICEKSGFANQSYFTKTFRLHTGFTPLKFRKNCGGTYWAQ